jgi:hypothetical protein
MKPYLTVMGNLVNNGAQVNKVMRGKRMEPCISQIMCCKRNKDSWIKKNAALEQQQWNPRIRSRINRWTQMEMAL